jgi:hypothetical protein
MGTELDDETAQPAALMMADIVGFSELEVSYQRAAVKGLFGALKGLDLLRDLDPKDCFLGTDPYSR